MASGRWWTLSKAVWWSLRGTTQSSSTSISSRDTNTCWNTSRGRYGADVDGERLIQLSYTFKLISQFRGFHTNISQRKNSPFSSDLLLIGLLCVTNNAGRFTLTQGCSSSQVSLVKSEETKVRQEDLSKLLYEVQLLRTQQDNMECQMQDMKQWVDCVCVCVLESLTLCSWGKNYFV